ncbi:hypothetical protein B0T22DRAFT_436861 [Podospora appendiculata]|uniref:Pyridoxamine 5'-phosphate oxidase N-terminal domain-containing protein n=1 Tax=Podospora appendiculata TaxID=314037 RepID=A0AAE1CGQ6_9PEZI|nr:hypothetical protein B0T22DRAFT_436861 [Podospora appendiculata]
MEQIPLNHEASAGETHMRVTSSMPQEVVQCLENARFLHLATCTDNIPHVSLMNYTYLPSSPYSALPVIVMTTNPASKKMNNLVANPNVSILVHDWVSHRPSTANRRMSGGSPGPEHRSSLAALLINLNTSAVSSISATINGSARLVESGTPEEAFYRAKHLENNTFDTEAPPPAAASSSSLLRRESVVEGDGGRGCFVAGEEVRVIVVGIRDVRIADWKGAVRDWVIAPEGSGSADADHRPMTNGV